MISALLFDSFNKYARITDADFALIEQHITRRFVKKRKALLMEGDTSRYVYFVEKGALRSYTIRQRRKRTRGTAGCGRALGGRPLQFCKPVARKYQYRSD